MTRQALQNPIRLCSMILALAVGSAALAEPPAKPAPEPNGEKPAQGAEPGAKEATRREAEQVVRGIELEVLNGDRWSAVKRIEQPLLFYGDSTRGNDRGSVWGWGETGRPVALLELFQNANDRAKWVFTVCNTSGRKVRARRGAGPWWQENDSAAELKDVPGAPAPSAEAPQRQRQLKLLAQKFTAHEFWDPNNSRYELRRLERALHSYRDKEGGLLEGGLFTLANGTNPEIMLFVEARADPKDKSRTAWQFTVGRVSHAELHLEYDGKEVFTAPRGDRLSAPDKPYWLGLIDATATPDPKK